MSTIQKNESDQRIELLIENLIRIQGSLNAKMDYLNRRLRQIEYTLEQTSQQEQHHALN
ncbi:hypothetical protein [Niallia sp. Krafla_26]|uniref:hypothetical protein n=1 Tax=Niallia sp. Krafla_26 TaxID=3064703 RepID=UPI003D16F4B9